MWGIYKTVSDGDNILKSEEVVISNEEIGETGEVDKQYGVSFLINDTTSGIFVWGRSDFIRVVQPVFKSSTLISDIDFGSPLIDPNTHGLTISSVLTLNEMFSLKFKEDSTVSIRVGNEEDNNKLIVTNDLKIRVIKDDENLLDDLNSFILRIQGKDSNMTKEIIKLIRDSQEFSEIDADDNIGDMKIVRDKVLELSKLGIKITDRILRKLKRAVREGRVNQFMIDVREKKISDRRV